ncbi:MAG: molybdenum cofactor guanylyltransferase [Thermodesulfovibrionales bacterium]|nr:molybdenum cofactor guanylyltransferase [Thermodesulfovibrionales bacterium]
MIQRRGDAEISGIAGVILAGGQNKRFPSLKSFIKINNYTIIEKNLILLKEIFDEVIISTNIPEKYFYLGAPLIGDILPSLGPMSGIYSSLLNSKHGSIFIVACDMPFIKKELIYFVCKKHLESFYSGHSETIDATVPIYDGEPQPLFGVYCNKAMPYLEAAILSGKTSLKRFLNEIKTRFINESEIRVVDPDGMSFVNINTIEDYKNVMRYA